MQMKDTTCKFAGKKQPVRTGWYLKLTADNIHCSGPGCKIKCLEAIWAIETETCLGKDHNYTEHTETSSALTGILGQFCDSMCLLKIQLFTGFTNFSTLNLSAKNYEKKEW